MASSNDLYNKQLQEFVSCAICLDYYDDPRVLPCSHTYCFKCIKSLVKARQVECPLKDNTIISENNIDKLPLNRTAKDMTEFVMTISSTVGNRNSKRCENCSKKNAVNWCDQCVVYYCDDCTKSIHEIKTLQSHVVSSLQDKIPSHCEKHPDERLKFWCDQCQALACRDCLLLVHKNHVFVSLADAAADIKTKLRQTEQEVQQMKQNLTKLVNATREARKSQNQSIQKQKESIEESFNRFVILLYTRKSEIIQQLTSGELETTKLLEKQLQELEQTLNLSIIQELCIKKILDSNDPLRVSKLKLALSQNYEKFIAQYNKLNQHYILTKHVFEANVTESQAIMGRISLFGEIRKDTCIMNESGVITKALDVSKLNTETKWTEKNVHFGRGYKFALNQPLRISSVGVQTDYAGDHIGFLLDGNGNVKCKATMKSGDTRMKWLNIPLNSKINNDDTIIVWAPSGNGSFSYKQGDNNYRKISQECSVQSKSIKSISDTDVESQIYLFDNNYSINMILLLAD